MRIGVRGKLFSAMKRRIGWHVRAPGTDPVPSG
jgi:hypothetical protein